MRTHPILGADHIYDPESGRFVNQKHRRVAEIINDYNQDLWLCYLPPESRRPEDVEPFAIVHRPANGNEYIVMTCREDEVDERLLARLWSADQTRPGNDALKYLEAKDRAAEALRLKEMMEKREEMHDQAHTLFKTPLHTYRMNGKKLNL